MELFDWFVNLIHRILYANHNWVDSYLDFVNAILLFGVGFPVVLSQILIDNDIRSVVEKRSRYRFWIGLLISMLVVINLIFVWIPYEADDPSDAHYLIPNILLTVSIIITVTFWFILRVYTFKVTLQRLKKFALRSLGKSGLIDQSILDDMVYLSMSNQSDYKGQILTALGEVCAVIQQQSYYDGSQLESPLRSVRTILASEKDKNDLELGYKILRDLHHNIANLTTNGRKSKRIVIEWVYLSGGLSKWILNLLKQIVRTHTPFENKGEDQKLILESYQVIAEQAIEFDYPEITIQIINEIQNLTEKDRGKKAFDVCFYISFYALKKKDFAIAKRLVKLLSGMNQRSIQQNDSSSMFLGSVANYWVINQATADEMVQTLCYARYDPNLTACCDFAIMIHRSNGNLETANNLMEMMASEKFKELASRK